MQEILDTDFFRKAIYFGSRELYREVELKNFCSRQVNKRTRESLLKYYNRMSYRPTPFGMFSAFAYIQWGESRCSLRMTEREKLSVQLDFRLSVSISNERSGPGNDGYLYYSNPSLYTFGKELRYIKLDTDSETPGQKQGIAALEKSRMLCRILEISRKGISRRDLCIFLASYTDAVSDLLDEMEEEGLLFNSSRPNITGENYLLRFGALAGNKTIRDLVHNLSEISSAEKLNVQEVENQIVPFSRHIEKLKHPFYVNYQKEICGDLSSHYQQNILEGLYCLERMQQSTIPGAISRFQINFNRRFEDREIPLMLALDPEAGLGYEQLEQSADAGDLLNGISFTGREEEKRLSWGLVQELLIRRICNLSAGSKIITLTDKDLIELPERGKGKYAPGISVMFRLHEHKVFIEEAGGVCGTSLAGRFTPFNEELLSHARHIARTEQEQNPDVLFAEIAHFIDEHAANINTREHIRKYEIPVLVHSTLPAEQVISLDDLYVSVRSGQVIIRSARLNKRIIPRLSTAYNYSRSELPVYRFLCDLQYQGIQSRFSLNFESLLPGLDFYPRIDYKNCILSLAMWVLKQDDITFILEAEDQYNTLLKMADERHISRYFGLSNGDRQLVFDLEDQSGMEIFLSELRNTNKVILKEFFLPADGKALLKDGYNKAYIHQMVASLTCTEESYSAGAISQSIPMKIKREFPPGDEWLYFKIYCAAQNGNYVLARKILPLLKRYQNGSWVEQWFFIRYYDEEGHHLRIRIKACEALIKELPGRLSRLLKPLAESGIISNIVLDTYKREIERYGAKTMADSERAFMSSSELVAAHLHQNRDEFQTIQFAMLSADAMLNSFEMDISARLDLLEGICNGLINELGEEKQLRDDLNRKYREHQQIIWSFMTEGKSFFGKEESFRMKIFKRDLSSLRNVINTLKPEVIKKYIADMLHMHMNRVFSAEQRKRELVIYYLCLRYYLSLKARNTVLPVA